jgi:hypothetical protein
MRQTDFAIISSSSVRITRTVARLASVEITAAFVALRDAFSSMPRKPSPSHFRERMGGQFSPMPAKKTSVSTPLSAAAKAPSHFFVWYRTRPRPRLPPLEHLRFPARASHACRGWSDFHVFLFHLRQLSFNEPCFGIFADVHRRRPFRHGHQFLTAGRRPGRGHAKQLGEAALQIIHFFEWIPTC